MIMDGSVVLYSGKGALTFSVCKCPWFLEKTKVSQLFFYAQFYLFWVKYFMTVEIVCYF